MSQPLDLKVESNTKDMTDWLHVANFVLKTDSSSVSKENSFYKTRSFMTMLTRPRHLPIS